MRFLWALLMLTVFVIGCAAPAPPPAPQAPQTPAPQPPPAPAPSPPEPGPAPDAENASADNATTPEPEDVPVNAPVPAGFESLCALSGKGQSMTCTGALLQIGCDFMTIPSALNALEPQYPMIRCLKWERNANATAKGVLRIPGWGWQVDKTQVINYVIVKDGAFVLIDSPARFKELFSPVASDKEALAFLLALNGALPATDVEPLRNLEGGTYLKDPSTIVSATVTAVDDGFKVYGHTGYGTCTDQIFEYNILVSQSGEVTQTSSTLVWDRTKKPGCIA